MKVWIDPGRDFVPLRIETYIVPHPHELLMAEVIGYEHPTLQRLTNNIKYEQDPESGFWVPVEGETELFRRKLVMKDGYTLEDIPAIPISGDETSEDIKRHAAILKQYIEGYVLEPMIPVMGKKVYKASSFKANHDIEDDIFVFKYPFDTPVYDEFKQGYYLTGPGEPEVVQDLPVRPDPLMEIEDITPGIDFSRRYIYMAVSILFLALAIYGAVSLRRHRRKTR